ncbi:hypothetical protein F4818DRAFT_417601 [Hypoxylon cercidicola]|nr:hypothetical protein F4818DRAFT_417601 [Hypoxylon cercidicola]
MSSESTAPDVVEPLATPSSMDPISTTSTVTQGLTSERVSAALQGRAKSLNFDDRFLPALDLARSQDREERGAVLTAPARANVKRRRSVVSAPGDALDDRVPRQFGDRPFSRNRLESPAISGNTRNSRSRNSATPRTSSRGTSTLRRISRPRGRPVRRATPYPDVVGSRKRPKVDGVGNIRRSLEVTKDRADPLLAQLPLSGDVKHHHSEDEATYEKKGVFRLKKNTGNFEFRFPKSLSQPEPLWRAGDGFSSDEAKPDFTFSMTGTHKQKRPRPLPGIGKLQLESEKMTREDAFGRHAKRSKTQHLTQYDVVHSRSEAKDIWPTAENFAEELVVRMRNPTVPDNEVIIPSTVLPKPTPVPQPRERLEYVPSSLRKRNHSEFENFGRRLQTHLLASTGDLESQGTHINQPDIGDDEEYEEYDGEETEGEYTIEEDESVSITGGSESDDEEHRNHGEKVASASYSPEYSPEDSTTSGLEDVKSEETESHLDDIWTAGDLARQYLQFSQALS